jgi:nucleoside-diphosphate kinase
MTDLEQTLVLLKPDAVRRGLVGTILARYESKGLSPVAIELRQIDAEMADRHYADHVAQPWYPPLRDYITSGPLVAMVLAGPSVIEVVRLMNGATNSAVAAPGTIRGDLSLSNRENLVHASDSPASAAKAVSYTHLTLPTN